MLAVVASRIFDPCTENRVHQRTSADEEPGGPLLRGVHQPTEVFSDAIRQGLGGLLPRCVEVNYIGTGNRLTGGAEGEHLVGIEKSEELPPRFSEALRARVRERITDVATPGQGTRLREPRRQARIIFGDQARRSNRTQGRLDYPNAASVRPGDQRPRLTHPRLTSPAGIDRAIIEVWWLLIGGLRRSGVMSYFGNRESAAPGYLFFRARSAIPSNLFRGPLLAKDFIIRISRCRFSD